MDLGIIETCGFAREVLQLSKKYLNEINNVIK